MSRSITTPGRAVTLLQCMRMECFTGEKGIEHVCACAYSMIILGIEREANTNSEPRERRRNKPTLFRAA